MPIHVSQSQPLMPRVPAAASVWSVLVTAPADGAWNMALDEALMDHAVRENRWMLRVYGWAAPTVSFGRNQAAARLYDANAIRDGGFDVVRRPTGGRAILHHREITYAVAAPLGAATSLADSYRFINELLASALRDLGVPAETSQVPHRVAPGPTPCFDLPSPGEIVAGGAKLAGSAQWRSQDALLQHGSILVDDDQGVLPSLLHEPVAIPPGAATLRAQLGVPPTLQMMADALGRAIRDAGGYPIPAGVDDRLASAANELAMRYRSPDWTWRR